MASINYPSALQLPSIHKVVGIQCSVRNRNMSEGLSSLRPEGGGGRSKSAYIIEVRSLQGNGKFTVKLSVIVFRAHLTTR